MGGLDAGVCAPKGFRAGGIWCGIKANSGKKDLALIYSEAVCTAAAVFTTNKVKAASVLVTQEHIKGGKIQAVIANSGNANACTGAEGLVAAKRMAELVADELAIPIERVAVASTGVIGVPFPLTAVEVEASSLADSMSADAIGAENALVAVMTTDTRKKFAAVELTLSGKQAFIGAMVKGSGMIHPNMATMLGFITTDAAISRELLDKALRNAVNHSFNRLTIDGDRSTNDMVLIMANGLAGNSCIEREETDGDYAVFANALTDLCVNLTKKMARDGEGAKKLLTVTVKGANSEEDAAVLAKSVANSSLVKTAIFGADANWGRVLCALGYAGVDFVPEKTAIRFVSKAGDILVCKNGGAEPFSEEVAKKILLEDEIEIAVTIDSGKEGAAIVWGCDLSYDYVKINGDYRS